MKRKDDMLAGVAFLFLLTLIFMCVTTIMLARRATAKSKQPVVYQVDTTKAHILFEDTWGKVILLKEEDL